MLGFGNMEMTIKALLEYVLPLLVHVQLLAHKLQDLQLGPLLLIHFLQLFQEQVVWL